MSKPSYEGIDPARLPEVQRRIAAINKYHAIQIPTGNDVSAIGASIGLSRFQFQRLVNAWRNHRDPTMLVIAKRGEAKRSYGIDPIAKRIAWDEINEAGTAAELSTLAPIIEQGCADAGVVPPSRPTIHNYIKKFRTTNEDRNGLPAAVVIGRMWPRIPVRQEATIVMPLVLCAVILPERFIVAARMSFDPEKPARVADIVNDLVAKNGSTGKPRMLLMEPNDHRMVETLLEKAGLDKVRGHRLSIQRQIARAFGGKLGSLDVVTRRAAANDPQAANLSRQDEAISQALAKRSIQNAIAKNNIGRKPQFSLLNEVWRQP